MPSAGDLRERVEFQEPTQQSDEYGNTVRGLTPRFERAALYLMRPGSEAVTAARLEGRQPVTVIVRFDAQTRTVSPAWRLRDVRTGAIYLIKAAEDMDRKRAWWSMVCEREVT